MQGCSYNRTPHRCLQPDLRPRLVSTCCVWQWCACCMHLRGPQALLQVLQGVLLELQTCRLNPCRCLGVWCAAVLLGSWPGWATSSLRLLECGPGSALYSAVTVLLPDLGLHRLVILSTKQQSAYTASEAFKLAHSSGGADGIHQPGCVSCANSEPSIGPAVWHLTRLSLLPGEL